MKCELVLAYLSDYIDGELSPLQEALVEEHVGSCLRCIAALHTLRKTILLSRIMYGQVSEPPAQIVRRVYYEVRIHYRHEPPALPPAPRRAKKAAKKAGTKKR